MPSPPALAIGPAATPLLHRNSSALMGWLADRHVPRPLRRSAYGLYCRVTGADPSEAELALDGYPSLGAFFVRRLRNGARPLDPDPRAWGSPCDGTVQAFDAVHQGSLLQAKGRGYRLEELLGGAGSGDLEGAWAWTLYLSPRDYHRVHAPRESTLLGVRWLPGGRRSVAPAVLARRERVLATNERAVLELEADGVRFYLVMVGALNVGRIRVGGVERGGAPRPFAAHFPRGAELARFEMGSTVVLVVPRTALEPVAELEVGKNVRLHQALARGRR